MIKKLIFALLIMLNLSACSSEVDCFTVDRVELVDFINFDNKSYYVYLRTSGFHDKVSFFELYRGKPDFDSCGNSSFEQISYVPADQVTDDGVLSKLVIDSEFNLEPIYEKDATEIPLTEVVIDVKIGERPRLKL